MRSKDDPAFSPQIAPNVLTTDNLETQRREDELTGTRDQLTLELAILSEQKSAKVIALLEELPRDDPNIANRHDADAHALSTPADPGAVVDAPKDTHELSNLVDRH